MEDHILNQQHTLASQLPVPLAPHVRRPWINSNTSLHPSFPPAQQIHGAKTGNFSVRDRHIFEIKAFVGLTRGQIVGYLGGFIKAEGQAGSVHVLGLNLLTAVVRHSHIKVSCLIVTGSTDVLLPKLAGIITPEKFPSLSLKVTG